MPIKISRIYHFTIGEGRGSEFIFQLPTDGEIFLSYRMRNLIIYMGIFLSLFVDPLGIQAQSKEDLLKKILNASSDTAKVHALNFLSLKLNWTKPDTSLLLAKQALEISERAGYTLGKAFSFESMCGAYTVLGSYPLATEYGLQALSIFSVLGDEQSVSSVMSGLAMCYREQGDASNALKYILESKRFKGGPNWSHTVNGILSSIYDLANQPDSTLKYAKQALEYLPTWCGIPYYIGRAMRKKGMSDSAMVYFKHGLYLASDQQVWIDVIDYENSIAELFLERGQIDSGRVYLRNAIGVGARGIYPKGTMKSAALLGTLFEGNNQPDSALKYLHMRITIQDSLFNRDKVIAVQALAFKEEQKTEELLQKEKAYKNRLILASLAAGLLLALLILVGVINRNKTRRKVMQKLRAKNEEIEKQKNLAEQALTDLNSTQEQLIQSEKMASLGELTAGIAHEIQNPLNFVNNFAEVNIELADELNTELEQGNYTEATAITSIIKDNVGKISFHGKRAESIVKSILQHTHASSGNKEPTDINALADEYLRLAFHGFRAKDKTFQSDFTTSFDSTIGKINIVQQDIARVLLNLINNAFYAVNEKRKLGVNGYLPSVHISTAMQGQQVCIAVNDNGNGISSTNIKKIFQPFFTTKPTGEGTGLGLSLCYDMMKAHGGEIEVSSVAGEGSTFTIVIPQ
jgi:two-component system, NtrC family, sensor kinase